MAKKDLVKAVAEEAGIALAAAERAIAATFDAILAGALAIEKVNLQGFGTFDLIKESAAREGRNPVSGDEITSYTLDI